MDERHLLLLGLLMSQSQHGYSINEFIEKNLGRVSGMKRATAYALLDRLEKKGLARMDVESQGNYPPRKVYSITPAGRQVFFTLLQHLLLVTDEGSSAAEIALMFTDWLDRAELQHYLQKRAAELKTRIDELRATPTHEHAPGVDLAVERKIALLQAEVEWIRNLIPRLEDRDTADSPSPSHNGGAN